MFFLDVDPVISSSKEIAYRDAFFQHYAAAMGQFLFACLQNSFPRSKESFDDNFKFDLARMLYRWVTG